MRLFVKYNHVNIVSTIIIFLIGCVAFSILLRFVIINQVDEDLKIEKNEIETYVQRFNRLPEIIEVHDQYTTYKSTGQPAEQAQKIFTHRDYVSTGHSKELLRSITFYVKAGSAWYFTTVSKSLEGTDTLIQTIIEITVALILLILVASLLINRFILKKLWEPFYTTLHTVKQFQLSDRASFRLTDTTIDEFNHLNSILKDSLTKAQQEYLSLKEFTENASHEMQTPLAVIQSKLDLLIQNEKLSGDESRSIQGAYIAVQNLSKLNQSLLLLAKIENNQFPVETKIDLKGMLENKIKQFDEIWKNRNIKLYQDIFPKTITGNSQLMQILLNNLLSNATKHNTNNGHIKITLQDSFEISNSGIAHPLDENQLFKRFSKQNKETVSFGLGLSIVRQIGIASGFSCTYHFQAPNLHTFRIKW